MEGANGREFRGRVSTDRQGQSGLGLDAQRKAVMDSSRRWQLEARCRVHRGRERKNSDRVQLRAAQAVCKKRKAKLVIAKLDRLSRNVAFIANLLEAGTDFLAVDNPHANKPMVQMMAVFAEIERDAISKRTREALAAAKARGVTLGNPRLAEARAGLNTARQEAADSFAANVRPIIKEIQASGITSLRGVAKALSVRGVKTARGGAWTAVQVADILRRA
jgi:DNA invertase Pin-like site-specific DNA recombinase